MKLVISALFAIVNLGAFAHEAPGLAARWEGTLHMPNQELTLNLDLAKTAKGDWIGSVSIPEGRITDAPLLGISAKETTVRFSIGFGDSIFEGALSEDGNGLAGTATSKEGSVPFELRRKGEANVKSPPVSTVVSKQFEGAWQGTLEVPGRQLRAILKLSGATGSLISVDEGGQEYPLTTVTQKGNQLQFEIRVINAKFTGTLNEAASEIAGEYVTSGASLPLVLRR